MKIAIMQPYFFPYIGYYQLINAVDEFVVYDNIQFTKKGWINRNRILVNNKDEYITIPLKKDSDYLNVNQRFLADTWHLDRKKILNRIIESYRKAPQFESVFPLFEGILNVEEENLFNFIYNSLGVILEFLNITTKITISSSISINHDLKSQEKILSICNVLGAKNYINPIGGIGLYDRTRFNNDLIDLNFQKPIILPYKQFNNQFIPSLSIIDILMFNSLSEINNNMLKHELISI